MEQRSTVLCSKATLNCLLTDERRPQIWENTGLDGIIGPVQAVPALPHGSVIIRIRDLDDPVH
jgi:hypothetical protein